MALCLLSCSCFHFFTSKLVFPRNFMEKKGFRNDVLASRTIGRNTKNSVVRPSFRAAKASRYGSLCCAGYKICVP